MKYKKTKNEINFRFWLVGLLVTILITSIIICITALEINVEKFIQNLSFYVGFAIGGILISLSLEIYHRFFKNNDNNNNSDEDV